MAAFVDRVNRLRRRQPIERVFANKRNPLEVLSSEEVRDRYRFRPKTIYFIFGLVFNDLDIPTLRSLPVPPLLSVLISLQFFVTGCHHLLLTAIHGVSRCSVRRVITRLTEALCRNMSQFIVFPALENDTDIVKREFYSIDGFPNVLGCVDSTHVKIRAPKRNEMDFVNMKGYHSVNIQMICDPQFIITDVVAKWPGSVHDSRIFRESSICASFENGNLDGLLLGDSGYACRTFLLTPFLNPQTPSQERYNRALTKTRVLIEQTFGSSLVYTNYDYDDPFRYNRALTKTRVLIEQTFGVLKSRFACLSYVLRVDEAKACRIAMACSVLHNIGIQRQDVFVRGTPPSDDHPMTVGEVGNQSGAHYRDFICATYFRE